MSSLFLRLFVIWSFSDVGKREGIAKFIFSQFKGHILIIQLFFSRKKLYCIIDKRDIVFTWQPWCLTKRGTVFPLGSFWSGSTRKRNKEKQTSSSSSSKFFLPLFSPEEFGGHDEVKSEFLHIFRAGFSVICLFMNICSFCFVASYWNVVRPCFLDAKNKALPSKRHYPPKVPILGPGHRPIYLVIISLQWPIKLLEFSSTYDSLMS